MKKNLHKILKENMRRFQTKNLTESNNIQSATADPSANWRSTFQDFPSTNDAVELIGWWTDVYSDMGSTLKTIAKQIEMGGQLSDVRSELVSIAQHTIKCRDKIQLISPQVYNQIKADVIIFDMIKDDLIEELKKLLKGNFNEAGSIVTQLEKIANSYSMVSEYLLEQSWDSADSGEESADSEYKNAVIAKASGIQDTRYKKPTGKTPWPPATEEYMKTLSEDQYYELIRNKYMEGYSLYEVFSWWMDVYPHASTMIAVERSIKPLRSVKGFWIQEDPALITKKQYGQFHDYIKALDREKFMR